MVKSKKEAAEELATLANLGTAESEYQNMATLMRIAHALELLYENGIEVRGEITAWKGEV